MYVVHFKRIAIGAENSAVASLLDDPTAWPAPPANAEQVRQRIEESARDCVQTQLRREVAQALPELINRLYDVAIEDGPLADYDGVAADQLDGFGVIDWSPLAAVPVDPRNNALNYEEFQRAVGLALAMRIDRIPCPVIPVAVVLDYARKDHRVGGIPGMKKSIAALRESGEPPKPVKIELTPSQRRERATLDPLTLALSKMGYAPGAPLAKLVECRNAVMINIANGVDTWEDLSPYSKKRLVYWLTDFHRLSAIALRESCERFNEPLPDELALPPQEDANDWD
jgi:hypothetical protein